MIGFVALHGTSGLWLLKIHHKTALKSDRWSLSYTHTCDISLDLEKCIYYIWLLPYTQPFKLPAQYDFGIIYFLNQKR